MAYVGNTTRLCQAIVDQDLEHVEDWLSQEGSDPNCRDYSKSAAFVLLHKVANNVSSWSNAIAPRGHVFVA